MKVNIVVDRKKRQQKLNTYFEQTLTIATVIASLSYLNLSAFYHCYVKLSKLLGTIIESKKDIIIDRKDKRYKVNIYLQKNYQQF